LTKLQMFYNTATKWLPLARWGPGQATEALWVLPRRVRRSLGPQEASPFPDSLAPWRGGALPQEPRSPRPTAVPAVDFPIPSPAPGPSPYVRGGAGGGVRRHTALPGAAPAAPAARRPPPGAASTRPLHPGTLGGRSGSAVPPRTQVGIAGRFAPARERAIDAHARDRYAGLRSPRPATGLVSPPPERRI
jgi:hypothetical protein